ncbi:hypothetical protein PTKIN_Ptkin13bG0012900 [Pterospermum kingtungense]
MQINACNGFYIVMLSLLINLTSLNRGLRLGVAVKRFTEFGGTIHRHPLQDLAFAVARFIQKGGSYINYYMYHGGTNFGRTAGGPFITTSYDYDAPIDEYGLIQEPKYSLPKELHRAIKQCKHALVSSDPTVTSSGTYQQAHVFSSMQESCAAFLSNYHTKSVTRVMFNNGHYNLPPWSISILPDCRNVAFNTAIVGAKTSQIQMLPTKSKIFSWETYDEDISSLGETSRFTDPGLLEQINVTRDTSDYLWYTTSVDVSPKESFLRGQKPTLNVNSAGHALHVFINGQFSGSAFGTRENRRFTFTGPVNLRAGTNRIALVSVAVGLPNVGLHYETWETGILSVLLHGLDQGKKDLTWQKWLYQLAHRTTVKQFVLKGETMNLVSLDGASSVEWIRSSLATRSRKSMTWYKAYFDAPGGVNYWLWICGVWERVKYGSMDRA